MQNEDLACPHEKKKLTSGNPGPLKKQSLLSLPIGIRVEGEGEEDWSSQLAMEELIKHVATGLENNVLRHQLQMEETLNLKWSWREEPNRGGFECTILAHILVETNPINI